MALLVLIPSVPPSYKLDPKLFATMFSPIFFKAACLEREARGTMCGGIAGRA